MADNKEELQANMYYEGIEEEEVDEIEESEEETFTLDFDKGIATVKEEGLIIDGEVVAGDPELARQVIDTINNSNETVPVEAIPAPAEPEPTPEPAPAPPAEPSYEEKLMSLFMNTLTSKAIRSLLDKQTKLERDTYDSAIRKTDGKMGRLGVMLEADIAEVFDKRSKELRESYRYGGFGMGTGQVQYDRIPKWAHGYIEEYIAQFVRQTADLLLEDVD